MSEKDDTYPDLSGLSDETRADTLVLRGPKRTKSSAMTMASKPVSAPEMGEVVHSKMEAQVSRLLSEVRGELAEQLEKLLGDMRKEFRVVTNAEVGAFVQATSEFRRLLYHLLAGVILGSMLGVIILFLIIAPRL